jgi:hypothetical protein
MKLLRQSLITFVLALSLLFATSRTLAGGGTIDIGGYCGSEACIMANPAPYGYYWNQEGDVWHLHQSQ